MRAPPPYFVSFREEQPFLRAARAALGEEETTILARLISGRLPPVSSMESLALLFGLSPRLIGTMAKRPTRYYRLFQIPSGRKTRYIQTPRIALKVIQRWFGYHLAAAASMPDHVHGFVPGRSTLTAACVHCPTDWLFSMDVRHFFGSVTKEAVFQLLTDLGYDRRGAHIVSELTTLFPSTTGETALPQGAPSSPVLANLAFRQTDGFLSELAAEKDLRLTRYADDLSFSGESSFPDDLESRVAEILTDGGWQIAQEKTRVSSLPAYSPQMLGLVVDGSRPRLPKRYRNRLRMMIHEVELGTLPPEKLKRFRGHIAYAAAVDDL